MSDSPTSPASGFAGKPVRAPGEDQPEPSVAPLTYLVWAVMIVSVITAIVALVAYNEMSRGLLRPRLEVELHEAQLRGIFGWAVLFASAYTVLGMRLLRVDTTNRPGEPRTLYWTTVAVAGFHLVVAGWLLNGAWGNWMDVVAFLLPAAVLGVLSMVSVRSALLGP